MNATFTKVKEVSGRTRQGAAGEGDVIDGNVAQLVEVSGSFKQKGEVRGDAAHQDLFVLPYVSMVTRQPPERGGVGGVLQQNPELCVFKVINMQSGIKESSSWDGCSSSRTLSIRVLIEMQRAGGAGLSADGTLQ